jgi:hypothetical protein
MPPPLRLLLDGDLRLEQVVVVVAVPGPLHRRFLRGRAT